MKKIFALIFHALPLSAHFDFFKDLRTRLDAAGPAVRMAVTTLMPGFETWLTAEDAVFRWARKSEFTAQIAEADTKIDRVLVAIHGVVHTGRYTSEAPVKASADKLYHKMQQYGNITRKPYPAQTGDLRALLEDFAGDYAQDVANLNMGVWVMQLQAACGGFVSLLKERDDEKIEKPTITARVARKGMEGAWRPIEDTINANANAAVGGAAEFVTFIDHLNPEIERLNNTFHRALKDIGEGDHTVVEPIPTQIYTEQPITPIPAIHYREDGKKTVKLWLGKDFSVTYKHNTDVGTAEVTIHGKGAYKGQKTVTFNIARQV
jgi:hypothetical protein